MNIQGYDDKFRSMELRKVHESECPAGCIFSADGKRLEGDCRAPASEECKLNKADAIRRKYEHT